MLLGWEGGAAVVCRFVNRGPFREVAKVQADVCKVTVRFTLRHRRAAADPPPTPQCLFPPETKDSPATSPIDTLSVGNSLDAARLAPVWPEQRLLFMDGFVRVWGRSTPSDELPYDVQEIRGDDGLTVSLVVRFTLPEYVKNTDGLELRVDDAGTGCAQVVKTADAHDVLDQYRRAQY